MGDQSTPDPDEVLGETIPVTNQHTVKMLLHTLRMGETGEAGPEGPELVRVAPSHYDHIAELARGGMGVVRRVLDRRSGREVAIKELLSDSPEVRRRFEREARVTAQLQHPSIVPVYEVGCWPDGMPFYAMKLVEGRPLDEIVREAPDGEARLALIPRIVPAVEAMAYAHERGVIHRDLKPANLLLGAFGETIVIDWGLATGFGEVDEEVERGAAAGNGDRAPEGAEASEDGSGIDASGGGGAAGDGGALGGGKRAAAEPRASKPSATKPSATKPRAAEPARSKPAASKPSAADPAASEPGASGASTSSSAHKRVSAVSSGSGLTVAGTVMGTPGYMSPEQANGEPLDARTDVYALGALLYHTLSGNPPYEGSNIFAVITEMATSPPLPLALMAPHAPPDLIAIIDKAMARDLSERYADAGELARDLKAFSTGRLVATYRYTSWELLTRFVRRNRALSLAIVGLVVVIVIGALSVFRAYQISERERERAVTAESQANAGERSTHERLAQAHWLASLRSLTRDEHLEAAVLAAAALRELPGNPASPYHALGGHDALSPAARHEQLAGPGAAWAAAKAMRFATRGRELPAHGDWVYDVMPSADGRWVVTTGADRRVHIWDAKAGELRRTLEGHAGTVFQAALRPDGEQLATTSYDGTVRLWSFPDGDLQATMDHPSARVYGACYASDDKLLAVGLGGILAVFDTRAQQLVDQLEMTDSLPWRLHCDTPRSQALVSVKGPEALLVDVEALRVVRRLPHVGASVVAVLPSADGESILSADRQGIVRRFDRASGELLSEMRIGARIETMAISADGHWLAVTNEAITILDALTLRPVARLAGHDGNVYTVAFGPQARRLYSGSFDHRVIEWQLGRAQGSHVLLTPTTSEIDSVAVSPDGRWLVSGGEDTRVHLWDLQTGQLRHTFGGHNAPIRGLRFIDSTRVASTGMDRTLYVHDLKARLSERIGELPHFGDELSLSPSARRLAVGGGDGDVLLYETDSWSRRVVAQVHASRAKWVGFAPSGKLLASAGYDGEVTLIDPEAGVVSRRWKAHATRINDADWRPGGELLTTSDLDGWVRSWEVATADKRSEWQVLGGERIQSLAWSPDGSRLLFATEVGVRCYRPDGTLEARLDLAARTTSAGWTKDGRVVFAALGKVFVMPLDAAAWQDAPEVLLNEAEQAAGVKLSELLEVGR